MGKWLSMTRSLSRPAHKVLTKTSSSSLAAFQESKEQFEREQLDIIHRAAESGHAPELDLAKLRAATA